MPKAAKQIIIDAIVKEIEQGTERNKVIAKYCKKFQKSTRTIDTYWKSAQEQYLIKQQAIKKELAEVDKEAAIEARKKAIMTADERKEYLTQIIKGEIQVPYTEVKYNPALKSFETIEFVELAGHIARINAIAELNKMEGDYAPAKIAQTDKNGNDVSFLKLSLPKGINIELPSNTEGDD
jgi:hypothetical protein